MQAGGDAPQDTRRSPAELLTAYDKQPDAWKAKHTPLTDALWKDVPKNAYPKKEDLKAALDIMGKNQGFKVILKKFSPPTRQAGAKQVFNCSYNNKQFKTQGEGKRNRGPAVNITADNKCGYFIVAEETTVGWIVTYGCLDHSEHPMNPKVLSEAEQQLTYTKYNSKIPDQLIDDLDPDITKGASAEKILYWLSIKAMNRGIPIAWEYNDIYNHFGASAAERAHDATGLADLLKKREVELQLMHRIEHARKNKLDQVFFEMVCGSAAWPRSEWEACGVRWLTLIILLTVSPSHTVCRRAPRPTGHATAMAT
ncbi:MAG: hypothetical protein AAGF86_14085 [Pseudomonadota bacterium]